MVDTFEFNKNYNNFWDPDVLKAFTTDIKATWKGSYGFSHTYPVDWDGKIVSTGNSTKCHIKCASLVRSMSIQASVPAILV